MTSFTKKFDLHSRKYQPNEAVESLASAITEAVEKKGFKVCAPIRLVWGNMDFGRSDRYFRIEVAVDDVNHKVRKDV